MIDQHHFVLQQLGETAGSEIGLGFRIDDSWNGGSDTLGASITHERTGNTSKGKLHFKTKTTEITGTDLATHMTIGDNGYVGIGTTSPKHALQVAGEIELSSWLRYENGSGVTSAGDFVIGRTDDSEYTSVGNALCFMSNDGSGGPDGWTVNLIIDESSGYVGINTENPTHNLSVYDDQTGKIIVGARSPWTGSPRTRAELILETGGAIRGGGIRIKQAQAPADRAEWWIGSPYESSGNFFTIGAVRRDYDTAVNAESPEVLNNSLFNIDWDAGRDGNGLTTIRGELNVTGRAVFDDLDIGSYTGVSIGGGTNRFYRTSSTIKIKKNLVPLDLGLDAVMRMNTFTYDLKSGEQTGLVGMIAEDMCEIDERLAIMSNDYEFGDDGKYVKDDKGVKKLLSNGQVPADWHTDATVSVLVNAVKELKEQNDELRTRIEDLEQGGQ